jgi:hypothetical protein
MTPDDLAQQVEAWRTGRKDLRQCKQLKGKITRESCEKYLQSGSHDITFANLKNKENDDLELHCNARYSVCAKCQFYKKYQYTDSLGKRVIKRPHFNKTNPSRFKK